MRTTTNTVQTCKADLPCNRIRVCNKGKRVTPQSAKIHCTNKARCENIDITHKKIHLKESSSNEAIFFWPKAQAVNNCFRLKWNKNMHKEEIETRYLAFHSNKKKKKNQLRRNFVHLEGRLFRRAGLEKPFDLLSATGFHVSVETAINLFFGINMQDTIRNNIWTVSLKLCSQHPGQNMKGILFCSTSGEKIFKSIVHRNFLVWIVLLVVKSKETPKLKL